MHRLDGPAVEINDYKSWHISGVQYFNKEDYFRAVENFYANNP